MRVLFILKIIIFFNAYVLFADGTKQLRKTSSEHTCLQLYDQSEGLGPFRKFATYEADSTHRLYFTISDFQKEVVFFGFNLDQYSDTTYFRIKDKHGNVVMGPQMVPETGSGFISNYTQAIAGPNYTGIISEPSGYTPFMFTPSAAGDYYIEFNLGDPIIPAPDSIKHRLFFEFFDLSVVNKTQHKSIDGRVWAKAWDFNTQDTTNIFSANLFIYADDGVITSVNFNGMQPHGFVVSSNGTGIKTTSNFYENRQSTEGDSTYPQYKVFLTFPDTTIFLPGKLGVLTATSGLTCTHQLQCINVTTSSAGSIEILINLNGLNGYQPGSADILLDSNVTSAGTYCIPWNGKNALGDSLSYDSSYQAIITFKKGLTHLPLFDVEGHPNGYIVNTLIPEKKLLELHWDDSMIGGSKNLDGCIPDTLSMQGCHGWAQNNNQTVTAHSPVNYPYFGNNKTLNTWWYATIQTDTISLVIPTPFTVSITSDHEIKKDTASICPGTAVAFNLHVSKDSPWHQYTWEANDHFSNMKDFELKGLSQSTEVTLTVVNSKTGCQADAVYIVLVNNIIVPNLVTPNQDNKNDTFEIQNLFPKTSVDIYNRWGESVYNSKNYDNQWGSQVKDGLYYYFIETNENCGSYKGWVEVVSNTTTP
jgi:gliding motility-associated-like protein